MRCLLPLIADIHSSWGCSIGVNESDDAPCASADRAPSAPAAATAPRPVMIARRCFMSCLATCPSWCLPRFHDVAPMIGRAPPAVKRVWAPRDRRSSPGRGARPRRRSDTASRPAMLPRARPSAALEFGRCLRPLAVDAKSFGDRGHVHVGLAEVVVHEPARVDANVRRRRGWQWRDCAGRCRRGCCRRPTSDRQLQARHVPERRRTEEERSVADQTDRPACLGRASCTPAAVPTPEPRCAP